MLKVLQFLFLSHVAAKVPKERPIDRAQRLANVTNTNISQRVMDGLNVEEIVARIRKELESQVLEERVK